MPMSFATFPFGPAYEEASQLRVVIDGHMQGFAVRLLGLPSMGIDSNPVAIPRASAEPAQEAQRLVAAAKVLY